MTSIILNYLKYFVPPDREQLLKLVESEETETRHFLELDNYEQCFDLNKLVTEMRFEIFSNFDSYPTFKNFNGYQTGGRIVMNSDNIYLTIGDYNQWDKVQKLDNNFGKVIKINTEKNIKLSEALRVKVIPTLMIYKFGEMVWRQSGDQDANTLISLMKDQLN